MRITKLPDGVQTEPSGDYMGKGSVVFQERKDILMKAWICVLACFGLLLISGSVFPEGDSDHWNMSDEEASVAMEAENIKLRDSGFEACADKGDFCRYRFADGAEYFYFAGVDVECFTVGDCAVAQSKCEDVYRRMFEEKEAKRRRNFEGEVEEEAESQEEDSESVGESAVEELKKKAKRFNPFK